MKQGFDFAAAFLGVLLSTLALSTELRASTYELKDDSLVVIGCQDPCACPVMSSYIEGSFVLTPIESGADPFDRYAVTDVDWTVIDPGGYTFVGEGEYRVGGEVALQHQMILDLSVNGGPPQHFDSGLVGGGLNFPEIDISLAVNEFFCWDSVLVVSAAPVAVSVDTGDLSLQSMSAVPNPFHQVTDISYVLPTAGAVDLRIYDVAGRMIRTLSFGEWHPAGRHTLVWDGRNEKGIDAPAGVYLAEFLAPHKRASLRIIRLR